MFFAGVSPAGGASNIWTVILGGNLNLSVTMTTISTLAAFGEFSMLTIVTSPRFYYSIKKKRKIISYYRYDAVLDFHPRSDDIQ